MNHSLRLAFCSMTAALGTAIMFLTGFVPIGTYVLPAFAGILSIFVVAEARTKWALSVYAVQSVLSVVLAVDKEAVLCFILFFGYYPILKAVLEGHLHLRWIRAAAKLAVFNAAVVFGFWFSVKFLGVPMDSFLIFGSHVLWLSLLAGNFVFLVYDYAISLLVIEYYNRLHPLLKKWLSMK